MRWNQWSRIFPQTTHLINCCLDIGRVLANKKVKEKKKILTPGVNLWLFEFYALNHLIQLKVEPATFETKKGLFFHLIFDV